MQNLLSLTTEYMILLRKVLHAQVNNDFVVSTSSKTEAAWSLSIFRRRVPEEMNLGF